jgi:hypothetical protein
MKRIVRKIRSWFTPTPTVPFSWSVEDFETAKRWAKSQPYPEQPKLSLWDKVNGENQRQDSAYTLAAINLAAFYKSHTNANN